jgi:phosphatidylserine decarboxylase
VVGVTEVPGALYTVNPIAVRRPFNIYTENHRHIVELDTEGFGKVLIIAVGATLVGSVNVLPQYKVPGTAVRKGADAGYFAFGGSTVLTLFQRSMVRLDDDLVENSTKPLESLVRVGTRIGTF